MTTSGIPAVLFWFGCFCKQFSLETASAQWISVFNCCSKWPRFNGCFLSLRGHFWWDVERLTIRNRDFAVMRVASIHPELLMCVRGLDMQVSAYQAILQADSYRGRSLHRPTKKLWIYNSVVVTIEIFYGDSYRWLTMGPYGKDIVNVPPPNSRYLVLGPQELTFELLHEQVGVWWSRTSSHGSTVDL